MSVDGARLVLFILGKGRSGSTLLDNALNQVPGVFSTGELWTRWRWKPLEDYTCGCGEKVGACPIWSRALARAYTAMDTPVGPRDLEVWKRDVLRWHRVRRLLRAGGSLASWPALDRLARFSGHLYRALGDVTGARVLVDSTKWPAVPGALGLVPGVRPYALHLVRDPRAVAFSWRRRKYDPGEQEEFPTFGAVSSALSWRGRNRVADAVRARLGRRGRLLRYEDFTADPRGELGAILRWLGVPADRLPFLDDGRTLRLGPNHTVVGNPSRYERGEIVVRADETWRSEITWHDRLVVTALTWPLLRTYGYPLSSRYSVKP